MKFATVMLCAFSAAIAAGCGSSGGSRPGDRDADAGCSMWKDLDERDRSLAVGQVVGSAIESVDPEHGAFIAKCMRGRRARVLEEIDRRCQNSELSTRVVMGRSLDAVLDECIQERLEGR